ncbi:hypothetical protein J6590_006869 [Homalodisca vitripennis]|nr:hypothetical protein J6590_006869 [Homalodisca vitripennis]
MTLEARNIALSVDHCSIIGDPPPARNVWTVDNIEEWTRDLQVIGIMGRLQATIHLL